jgi:hypothetical protein
LICSFNFLIFLAVCLNISTVINIKILTNSNQQTQSYKFTSHIAVFLSVVLITEMLDIDLPNISIILVHVFPLIHGLPNILVHLFLWIDGLQSISFILVHMFLWMHGLPIILRGYHTLQGDNSVVPYTSGKIWSARLIFLFFWQCVWIYPL